LRQQTRGSEEPLITVGHIVGPHGVRGELRVVPTTDFPERFAPGSEVTVVQPTPRTLTVESSRPHKSALLVKFSEVHGRSEAESLRNALLQVPVSEVIPLAEGEFYRFELLGLQVLSAEGTSLGTVVDIIETGANDVLVVEPAADDARRPLLIPATREIVVAIEPDKGQILVRPLAGLVD